MFVRPSWSTWLAAIAFCCCAWKATPAIAASIAVVHTTVIDPVAGSSTPDRTVVISDDRITSISQGGAPTDARVIDGRGKFLVPGLCDMHVHVAGVTADAKWSRQTVLPLLVANG